MAACFAKGRSRTSGFSRPRATRGAPSASRSSSGIATAPRRACPDHDSMKGAYLGPKYSAADIASFLGTRKAPAIQLERDELIEHVAEILADGKIVGWFDGRMEFGPRALGARSILGDPRNPCMQAQMNLKIKFREGFRPFAPSVLRERVSDYFDLACDSPYMLLVEIGRAHV